MHLGVPLDDRLAVDLGPLHVVVAGHEVDHLGAELLGEFLDHLLFVVDVAGVADQPAEAHAAGLGELHDALADVVGRVHGHHLAGADDVDLLRLAVADRHGETAADHVAQNVVEDVVEAFALLVGAQRFQHVDGGDDAAAGAADARLRAAGLDAPGAAVAGLADIVQFHVLAFLAQGVEHRFLGQAAEQQAGGVGLGVAADDHDLSAHLRQTGHGVLGGGGFADAAFAVNCHLSHLYSS